MKVKGRSGDLVRMLSSLAGKITQHFSCNNDSLKEEKGSLSSFINMPAGRKSGKGSGAQPKSTGKSSRKPSSGGKTALGGAPGGALQEEERCATRTPPLLPAIQPDNELEDAIDDGKLSELSAEEPDSSECEYKINIKVITIVPHVSVHATHFNFKANYSNCS